MLRTEYPDREQEIAIMDMVAFTAEGSMPDPVVSIEEIVQARQAVDRVRIEDSVKEYMVDLVRATRHIEQVDVDLSPYVTLGASPRATIYLAIASRARAYLQGRNYVTPHDVKAIAPDVLRHRILTSYEAEADSVTTDDLITRILEHQPVP
ncbi:MAG: MoxR family ATPase, partial [Rhodospirillales bacterium]|nr:MoxR family ATPase [Rhodospirillales bacterium]